MPAASTAQSAAAVAEVVALTITAEALPIAEAATAAAAHNAAASEICDVHSRK
jgi:hypothetical protein